MKTINVKANEKQAVFSMQQSGHDSDGVIEFYMHKQGDNELEGNIFGFLPISSLTVTELIEHEKIVAVEIKVTIEEDPRLKAFSVFSPYAGRGVGIVKHCPDKVFCGSWTYPVDINFHSQTDRKGPAHWDWETYVLQFSPTGKKEIGMIRGNEGRTNYPIFLNNYKTYYSLEDHVNAAKLFSQESSTFEQNSGNSLLDKVNQWRRNSSIMPLYADDTMMTISQAHSDYMLANNWNGPKDMLGTPYSSEVSNNSPDLNFLEYDRIVYVKGGIEADSSDLIDLASLYNEAITQWLGGVEKTANLLRSDFNAAGFGLSFKLESSAPVSLAKKIYKVYITMDFAKIEGITIDNFLDQLGDETRFALNSHNPMCKTFYFYNFNPIPSETYYLYGIFNDTSCLDAEANIMTDFSKWPIEKQIAWKLGHGLNETPSVNPMEYPVLLQTAVFSTNYLEAGFISKITTVSGGFGEYTVVTADGGERKGVKGFSHVTYPVGRWVIIHKGETHWYIVPSSDLYYKNVVKNSAGLT